MQNTNNMLLISLHMHAYKQYVEVHTYVHNIYVAIHIPVTQTYHVHHGAGEIFHSHFNNINQQISDASHNVLSSLSSSG